MLFKKDILERIAAGEVTLAFRRWQRPTVKPGGRLRTAVGVLAIDSVEPVQLSAIDGAEARRAGFASLAELTAELRRRPTGRFYRIAFHLAGEDPRRGLARQTRLAAGEMDEIAARLARLDAGRAGPWTRRVLEIIGAEEGLPAAEIAARLGFERLALKRRIRQLKELGLTESLAVGYRLSPRGQVVRRRLTPRP